MKTIKVIDKLLLDKEGLKCKGQGRGSRKQKVHLRQGDMDGACSIYSLMMDLIILGAIKHDEACLNRKGHDGRTSKGRLFHEFCDKNGLYRDGSHFENVTNDLNHSFKKQIDAHWHEAKEMSNRDIVDLISEKIEDNQPIIISTIFEGGAHALVAVGIEKDGDKVTKIFCLDPGHDAPFYTYWNVVIDVRNDTNTKYSYLYMSKSVSYNVDLDDMIEIIRK